MYVFSSKVTNIKSFIMAVITRRFRCITFLHCTRKPCLRCMFIVAPAYMQFSVSIKLKLIVCSVEQFLIIPHLSKEVEERFALHHTRSLSILYALVLATFTSLRFEEQRTLLVRPMFGKLF